MTINKYIELKQRAKNVTCDLDNCLHGEYTKNYAGTESLMHDAKEVINNLEMIVDNLIGMAEIEDLF